jgi:hypothetical protein
VCSSDLSNACTTQGSQKSLANSTRHRIARFGFPRSPKFLIRFKINTIKQQALTGTQRNKEGEQLDEDIPKRQEEIILIKGVKRNFKSTLKEKLDKRNGKVKRKKSFIVEKKEFLALILEASNFMPNCQYSEEILVENWQREAN